MYSNYEVCSVKKYLELMRLADEENKDFEYKVVVLETVEGTKDAIDFILKNSSDGELRDAIDRIFFKYNCKIQMDVARIILSGESVYEVNLYFNSIPKSVCKKLMGLKKSMNNVIEEDYNLLSDIFKKRKKYFIRKFEQIK